MAGQGKHAKDPRVAPYGKHGVEVRPRVGAYHVVVAVLLVAALALVPLSYGQSHIGLDAQAFADPTRTAFPELSDSWVGQEVDDAAKSAVDSPVPRKRVEYTSQVAAKLQNSLMAGGCELVSLAIALESMNIPTDLDAIVSDHLEIDGHFATGYSGNPYVAGAGYPAGIARAANSYLASIGSKAQARDLTGAPFDTLREFVDAGYPVLVWTTMDLGEPSFAAAFDDGKEWYSNEHCVVMYDAGERYVLVSDPLAGLVQRDGDRFAHIYDACGSMALVVY